jgi:hypothetical protein
MSVAKFQKYARSLGKENFPWEEIRKAEMEHWDRIRKEPETLRANEELSMKELVSEIRFV